MLSCPSVMSPSLANGHGHVGDATPLPPARERPGLKLTCTADADTDAASKKRKRDDHDGETEEKAKTKKKARKEEKKARKEERGKRKEKKEKRKKEKKAKKEEEKKKKEKKKKKLKKEKRKEKKEKEKEPNPPALDQDQPKECPASAVAASPTKSLLKKPYDPASSSAPPATPPMPPASPAGTSAQQRKSVTFAADAKQTDGDSIKQLYLALDPFGKNRTRGGVTPAVNGRSHVPSSPPKDKQEEEGTRSTEAKEAEQQQQQQQRHTKRGGSNNDGSTKPYLDYLANFHLHRLGTATATTTHWKFEKAKQNWILKNALDPEAIPASCHEALGVYVAGLQGTGARDRLLAEAKSALVRDDERLVIRAKVVARALGRRDLASDSDGDSDSDSDGENASGKSTDGKSANGKSMIVNRAASSSSDSDSSSSSESDSDSD